MKYSVDELFGKLERADAAGDSEAAKVIADEIRRVQAAPVNTAYQPTRRSPDDLREIAAKNAAANPVTKDMNNVQLFAAGAGKSIYDTGRGLAQVGDSVADFFAPRANTLSSLVTGQDNSRAAAGRMETDRQRQLDAALMDTGYGLAGNISGTIGQFVLPGGALKAATYANKIARAAPALNAASKVFLPNSLGGAATQGAVIGASQQLGVDDSRLRNTLLGTGAAYAGAAAPRVLGSLYRATGSYTGKVTASGVDRRIGDILRAEADNPNALLTVNPSRIAGAQRTLAEETLDAGLARLERNARSTGKGWDSLDRTNNAARVGAIEKFAGNENTLEAAKLARDKASNPLRKEAMQLDGVDTARLLSQIKRLETSQVGRPVVQSGLAQVRSLLTRQVSEAERKKTALAAMDGFVSTGRKSAADFAAGNRPCRLSGAANCQKASSHHKPARMP